MTHLRFDGLDRSLNGSFVPVYRRGKLVHVEHRRNDRLAIAMLGGRAAPRPTICAARALSRREHRLDLAALDAARAEHKPRTRPPTTRCAPRSTGWSTGIEERAASTARASPASDPPAAPEFVQNGGLPGDLSELRTVSPPFLPPRFPRPRRRSPSPPPLAETAFPFALLG